MDAAMSPKFFPTVMIILSVCAAIGYVPSGDWRHIGYFAAAAVLTFCVTY